MERYPLTYAGWSALQHELFQCDDEQLVTEASAIAADCRAYIAQKFEIDVFTFDLYRSLDIRSAKTIGWLLATAIINRQPFAIKGSQFTVSIRLESNLQELLIGLDRAIIFKGL